MGVFELLFSILPLGKISFKLSWSLWDDFCITREKAWVQQSESKKSFFFQLSITTNNFHVDGLNMNVQQRILKLSYIASFSTVFHLTSRYFKQQFPAWIHIFSSHRQSLLTPRTLFCARSQREYINNWKKSICSHSLAFCIPHPTSRRTYPMTDIEIEPFFSRISPLHVAIIFIHLQKIYLFDFPFFPFSASFYSVKKWMRLRSIDWCWATR